MIASDAKFVDKLVIDNSGNSVKIFAFEKRSGRA